MVTTTKTADFVGRALVTPDTDARDYLLRPTGAGDRDFMGRLLTGGDEGGDVSALLAEAAVRFDFSEYDDIADMVDVNGGWGPFGTTHLVNESHAFSADGLRFTTIDTELSHKFWLSIEGVASPLSFGADGMTILDVRIVHSAWGAGLSAGAVDILGDGNDDAAPQCTLLFRRGDPEGGSPDTIVDRTEVYLVDTADTYDTIHDTGTEEDLAYSELSTSLGTFVTAVVIDVDGQEVRSTYSSPDFGPETSADAFVKPVPDFVADPKVVDTVNYNQSGSVNDETMIELLAWNRVLTAPELAALVAHFTA